MWATVVPLLAEHFTVVTTDLRGYGDSAKPAPRPDGSTYSKRAMAGDQLRLMLSLGFDQFAVVGHDRGARVAHRLALDFSEAVSRVAVLDVVPTLHMFENVDRAMASSYFHWFFLTQPNVLPEALIGADPEAWLRSRFTGRNAGGRPLDEAAFAEYLRCFATPEAIAATCADYRAAASIDLEHDRADRAEGRMVTAPLLALWGSASYVGRSFDVTEVWRGYGHDVRGAAVHADHYLAEEQPEQTAEALLQFLGAPEPTRSSGRIS
ncbi:alpha/beta fold hydrolase (plasmid) [Rathayibacter sp. VKM Ac-2760]|nr:alpha/beta fold hydrolase [Rathayibacter sp. VKM Ac-2760]